MRLAAFVVLAAACSKPAPAGAPDAAPAPPAVAASSVAAPSAAPPAAPPLVGPLRTLAAADLPKDITIAGKLSKAVGWTDKNGENVAVFAVRWVDTVEDHDALRNVYLTAEHAAYRQGVKTVLRTVKDSRESCDDAGMKASFVDDSIGVTDLDGDGIGELTFAYRITCEGHHTPFTLKLIVLEGGDKYILRATSPTAFDVDPSFSGAPPSFLEHAKARWELSARGRR